MATKEQTEKNLTKLENRNQKKNNCMGISSEWDCTREDMNVAMKAKTKERKWFSFISIWKQRHLNHYVKAKIDNMLSNNVGGFTAAVL